MSNGHLVSREVVQAVGRDNERLAHTPRDLGNLARPYPTQAFPSPSRMARTVSQNDSYPEWPANKFLISIEHHEFEGPGTLTGQPVEALPDEPIVSTVDKKIAQTLSGIYLPENSRVMAQYFNARWYITWSQVRFRATADEEIAEGATGDVTLTDSGATVEAYALSAVSAGDVILVHWFTDEQRFNIEKRAGGGVIIETTTPISAATDLGPGSGTVDLIRRKRSDNSWETYATGVTVWNACPVTILAGIRGQAKRVDDGDLYIDVECCILGMS